MKNKVSIHAFRLNTTIVRILKRNVKISRILSVTSRVTHLFTGIYLHRSFYLCIYGANRVEVSCFLFCFLLSCPKNEIQKIKLKNNFPTFFPGNLVFDFLSHK